MSAKRAQEPRLRRPMSAGQRAKLSATQPYYSALAITTGLTLRAVFRLALRQTEGLIGSIIRLLGLDPRGARSFNAEPAPRTGEGWGSV